MGFHKNPEAGSGSLTTVGNIWLIVYIDDILILAESQEVALDHTFTTGFVINHEKLVLCPTKTIEFLGILVDSTLKELRLPPRKITRISAEARRIAKQKRRHLHTH